MKDIMKPSQLQQQLPLQQLILATLILENQKKAQETTPAIS